MFTLMTALHLLAVVLTVGPLAVAVMTAMRGMRTRDASATATAARTTTIYGYGSVLAVVFGFALMSSTSPYTHKAVATFGETWIWLSALLWLIGVLVALVVTRPALRAATDRINNDAPIGGAAARATASGGLVTVILIAVIVLMVYQPGG